ncbi:GHKL domain-containing protein [[Ruminococcus] torques]|uniref:GHKL domain-containing protein n=1 Tax=[Ruminococcus] torques TaxID=33039 RepID=UPI003FF0AEDC
MRIAICEDEEFIQNSIEKNVEKCLEITGMAGKCECFVSAEELLEKGNMPYALYILDVEMKKLSGLELAEHIRTEDRNAVIIFMTNHSEMMQKAFDVQAFQYLVKPIDSDTAHNVIMRALRIIREKRNYIRFVLYFFSRRKKNAPERKVQKSFLIIPILSAVLIIYLHEAQIMRNSIDLIFSWIVTIIVIVINIITYILFRKQEQYHIAEGEMKNQLKEYEYQKLHYEQVEQHQQEIRKIRHDMKNQIAGIYGYLEKGEIEEGKREVCSILNQLEKAEQKLFTANAVVNGILNMKYVEIEAKQIEAKLDVKLPEILGITGTDLGVLFGNILDNAIEACESCKKEKWIDLFAVYENHGIVICCKNSCSETVMDLHTRKSDKRNHGFGLSSVKQIVEKYNGDVWWESEKESFTLNINLWEKIEK